MVQTLNRALNSLKLSNQTELNEFKTKLDRGATWLFPLVFLLFNLFYWSYYLVVISSSMTSK